MRASIVTIDQGSSGTKVLAFDQEGRVLFRSHRPLRTVKPFPDHVEQDPLQVLEETRSALEEVLSSLQSGGYDPLAIGMACQRSSFLLWDRNRGEPFIPIITWQDLRAKSICGDLEGYRETIYEKTGLPLTGHYGGPKFLWLIKNNPEISKWMKGPGATYSPWNSFLLWHLTEERICATDESIAGRTLFFNIRERNWDKELLKLFNVPEGILPQVHPTCQLYGHYKFKDRSIPLVCSLGDHQGALIGMGGLEKGRCGLNYGTSGGALINLGPYPHILKGLLINIAYSTSKEVYYTAEGTVNAVGSLFEWFEAEKGISGASRDWETRMTPASEGWFMLPGMYGIASPYWKETAPTAFSGGQGIPSAGVLLRAGMESIAFLMADILERLREIPGFEIKQITAGGGAARPPLLQFQADLLGLPIHHSSVTDTTALGCAFLAGLHVGFWKDVKEVQGLIRSDETYSPRLSLSLRQTLLEGWHRVLREEGILA